MPAAVLGLVLCAATSETNLPGFVAFNVHLLHDAIHGTRCLRQGGGAPMENSVLHRAEFLQNSCVL